MPSAALLVIVIIGSIAGGDEDTDTASPGGAQSSPPAGDVPTEDPDTGEPEPEPEPEPEENPYDEQYGTFQPIDQAETGDTTVALPEGAAAGVVTATHEGSANFVITALDEANQPTGDLLVNTIGNYAGTTAYGLQALGDAVKIQVTADGAWTLNIAPISSAPPLPNPASGRGDAVFLFDAEATDWTIQHTGESNFVVIQFTDPFPNLAVNEIGNYSGTVPALGGPSVVTVQADGDWTIASD